MLVDWVLPISLYLIFFFPMMRFLTKCITKYRGRNEIPDDWKVPITGIYSGALVYAYQESGATSGWLVLSSTAVASALGWHLLLRSFLLATVLATATAVVLFQVAAYLYAGYLDPFFLVAVITSSVICLLITVTVGMLVRSIKGKNNAL